MKGFVFKNNKNLETLNFIDGLRAFAILLVVLHHVGEIFLEAKIFRILSPFGRYGVQLFFVMSAFTMCLTNYNNNFSYKNVKNFYFKRIFRIAPLYFLAIPFYMFISYLSSVLNISSITIFNDYNFANIFSNILFLHGFYPAGNNTIVPGGWSIGCEMIFYFIFPFLFYFVKKSIHYLFLVQFFAWFAVIGLLYIATFYGHKGEGGGSSFVYYFIANQMSPFLLGIILFFKWESKIFFKVIKFCSLISLGLLIFLNNKYVWLLTPLFVGFISSYFALVFQKLHFSNLFYSIGKMSFSIYISHFFFVWLVGLFFSKFKFIMNANIVAIISVLLIVISSFLFSKFTYNFIELPMIRFGKKLFYNKPLV